jgi:RNA ligase (TIGR02306 family)
VERKLASIRRIKEIKPHPNADLLDLAIVDGWQMVTAKSNGFKTGDLVIYFEIDSFLPIREEFEFLRKGCFKKMGEKEGFRLRTIKLRGELSQGLIIPMEDFCDWDGENWVYRDQGNVITESKKDGDNLIVHMLMEEAIAEEGDDVTEYLGVVKWDPPIPACLGGEVKGNFPSFIPKTDQERVQNIIDKLDLTSHEGYEVTVKLDGSSCTIYKNGDDYGVCSRNLDLKETEGNSFWRVARKNKIIEALQSLGNYAVQGELMGPGIQGNRENLKDIELYIFDVYDIDEQCYLSPYDRDMFMFELREHGAVVEHIPVLSVSPMSDLNFVDVNDFLKLADSIKSLHNDVAEGIVFKSVTGRNSFKVISNKFLLGEK